MSTLFLLESCTLLSLWLACHAELPLGGFIRSVMARAVPLLSCIQLYVSPILGPDVERALHWQCPAQKTCLERPSFLLSLSESRPWPPVCGAACFVFREEGDDVTLDILSRVFFKFPVESCSLRAWNPPSGPCYHPGRREDALQ